MSQSTQTVSPTFTTSPEPSPSPSGTGNPRHTLVGAIRWDAWVGDRPTFGDATSENRVGLVVERTLGPQKYHYRLPFFAKILGPEQVQVRGDSQEVMDQEIAYAASAGIDYWAFVFYPPGSGLDAERNLYLSSQRRNEINFSLVLDSPGRLLEPATRSLFTGYFSLPNYQKVLGGRPLLFIFGSNGLSREGVDALRAESQSAGLASPYIVFMGWAASEVKATLAGNGLDAGSAYAQVGENGQSFSVLARRAEKGWEDDRQAGIKVVPWVTSGWDPRPRIDHPTPWVTYPANSWTEPPTPAEIAYHLQKALEWAAQYPETAEANAVIIYAWNEFDEGGWLAPTLSEGNARLEAVQRVLGKQK